MSPIRLPRRRPAPRYEAMIPLINVAFLLMAFFMLIGRIDTTGPFELVPPRSEVVNPLPQGGATISMSATGALALDGVPVDAGELIETVAADAPELVRINADAAAPLGHFLPLVAALEDRGVPRVVLVVTPPEVPQ